MAGFSKHRWPTGGPERDLLEYLDDLHRAHGQPSMARIGKAVGLVAATVSAFFTGARPIGPERLREIVTYLDGDPARAESLRRAAATVRNDRRSSNPEPRWAADTSRLDVLLFDRAANRLHRPELMVGRQRVIETVSARLDEGGRVLLHGLGGAGKTAIAATVADRSVDARKGPYLWLRTGDADSDVLLDGLARCLATALGLGGGGPEGDARLLMIGHQLEELGVRLCVLDDVWNASALHTVLRAIPAGIAVLVTSRLKLGVEHQVEVDGLDPAEAARLLAHHAHDDTYASHPDAAALCRDLRHHPYLIEIAGHRLRQYALTPADLRKEVDGAPHDLAMPAGFAAPGRENARRLLDTTIDALPQADARAALGAIGSLASGTVTPELLSCCLGISLNRSRAALNALVDVSFAKRSAGVYVLHDLTVAYARSVLPPAPARVRDFVLAYASDHDLLARELDNIVAEAALDPTIVEQLASCGYLDTHGHTLPLLRLLDRAVESGLGDRHLLLSKRGNASFHEEDFAAAVTHYRAALELAPTPQRRVILLSVIAKALAEDGRHDEAEQTFASAYALARVNSDEVGTMRTLEAHSVAAFRQRDFDRVLALTQQGVELSRKLGDRAREAIFLNNLGSAHFEIGVSTALRYHRSAMEIAEGNEHILALTHRCVGADYHAQEEFEPAHEHFGTALRLYERLGQSGSEAKLRRLMRRFGYPT
ncbi:NB-ARC domain-containing protein [Actinoplanes sp. NPDC089786]|uniref:NB-ARC domain-containing protein n=1 Tax=Actinoplanes sp. NPDC089786 TaxID=3155185 RepID=UPI0034140DA5